MVRPYIYFHTLTLLFMGSFNLILAPVAIWAGTFQAYDYLDPKVASINSKTLEIFSDLAPIGLGGHLSLV